MFTKRNPVDEAKKEGSGTKHNVADTAETSPLIYARVAGFLLILLVVVGPFSLIYVSTTLIVPGDATATADNIRERDTSEEKSSSPYERTRRKTLVPPQAARMSLATTDQTTVDSVLEGAKEMRDGKT